MERQIKFSLANVKEINLEEYPSDEFSVVELDFLGSNPNSHQLEISDEVLKKCAGSIRGKWIVADMSGIIDCGTHSVKEQIVGQIIRDQEIRFKEKDSYLRAIATGVISKIYAKSFCKLFEDGSNRSVSVEMTCLSNEENEDIIENFNIVGVTVLGKMIRPSSPGSTIDFVRFSEEDANNYINTMRGDKLSQLKEFAKERKQSMAVSYKVDKSKDAMSNKAWGDIDKISLRDKIMEASNKASLVKDVYMLVEDGYEDAPSEKLKYPVMCFEGDKLVYNRDALSTALGYAKKEGEDSVVNKIEKIYKKLNLDNEGKEEEAKMAKEIEFAAVDIGDMWGKIYEAIRKHDAWEYSIEGIYEEDNKKFAVLRARDGDLFRLDFSLTEEGLVVADEIVAVAKEFVETDEIRKFAEPEDADKFKKFEDDESDDDDDKDEKPVEMSEDEMKAEMARLTSEIENRDNIIMEKDSELETLRQFKADVEAKEKAGKVEGIMAEVKEWLSDEQIKDFREEGLACEMCDIDGWANKIKAVAFSAVKKPAKKNNSNADGIWGFAAPIAIEKKSNSLWD